jgi:hypothetical protein
MDSGNRVLDWPVARQDIDWLLPDSRAAFELLKRFSEICAF